MPPGPWGPEELHHLHAMVLTFTVQVCIYLLDGRVESYKILAARESEKCSLQSFQLLTQRKFTQKMSVVV